MDNTIYIGVAYQSQLMRSMDSVANNIANVNTAGYKKEAHLFTDYLIDASSNPATHEMVSFSNDFGMVRDLSEGDFDATGRPLDAAISGEGYFVADRDGQQVFTRAGNFSMNLEGELITAAGDTVQGFGGSGVSLENGDHNITISGEGVISALDAGGSVVTRGQLAVVTFDNPRELKKQGEGYFVAPDGVVPRAAVPNEDYRIAHKMVEKSNVNPTQEMSELIKVTRAIASQAKMLDDLHKLQQSMMQIAQPSN